MSSVKEVIREIQQHAKVLKERVSPGQPAVLNEACSVGDGVWQGDLGIEIVSAVPEGYVLVEKPKEDDKQIVPGNTQGSKHVLRSIVGVSIWRPKNWPSEIGIFGPCIVAESEAVIDHPTHGEVTISAGHTILCRYQREWDQEQKKARRNAD